VGYRKIFNNRREKEWRKGETRDFSVGEGIGQEENGDIGSGKRTKKKVVGRRRCTRGNTRKNIRRGRHASKKDNENGKKIRRGSKKDNENGKNYIET
jgi:hypothetical protein